MSFSSVSGHSGNLVRSQSLPSLTFFSSDAVDQVHATHAVAERALSARERSSPAPLLEQMILDVLTRDPQIAAAIATRGSVVRRALMAAATQFLSRRLDESHMIVVFLDQRSHIHDLSRTTQAA